MAKIGIGESLEIQVVTPTLDVAILSSDVEVSDVRPTLEVEELPCP